MFLTVDPFLYACTIKNWFFENTHPQCKNCTKVPIKNKVNMWQTFYTLVAILYMSLNFLHIYNSLRSFLTIMDNGNDPPTLTPNSEFSDEKTENH